MKIDRNHSPFAGKKRKRKFLSAGVIALCSMIMMIAPVQAQSAVKLTAATYNIAAMTSSNARDVSSMLAREGVDLIGIQELQTYHSSSDVIDALAGRRFEHTFFSKLNLTNKGLSGQGILSTLPFIETQETELDTQEKNPKIIQRVLAEKEGKQIAFYNVHLTWKSKDVRTAQIQTLKEMIDQDPAPYKIAVGDFNVDSGLEYLPLLENMQAARDENKDYPQTFWDQENYPYMEFFGIDQIFVSRNIQIEKTRIMGQKSSDHYCLATDLTLLDEEAYSTEWAQGLLKEAKALAAKEEDFTQNSLENLNLQMNAVQKLLGQENQPAQKELDAAAQKLYQALVNLERMNPWRLTKDGYMFRLDGKWMKDGWLTYNGNRYLFDERGIMQTGLHQDGDRMLCFQDSGELILDGWGKYNNDWYYADENGQLLTGWQFLDLKWYYFSKTGQAKKGWEEQAGKWYYFQDDCSMATGSIRVGSDLCTFDNEGVWQFTIEDKTPDLKRPAASGNSTLKPQKSPAAGSADKTILQNIGSAIWSEKSPQ